MYHQTNDDIMQRLAEYSKAKIGFQCNLDEDPPHQPHGSVDGVGDDCFDQRKALWQTALPFEAPTELTQAQLDDSPLQATSEGLVISERGSDNTDKVVASEACDAVVCEGTSNVSRSRISTIGPAGEQQRVSNPRHSLKVNRLKA